MQMDRGRWVRMSVILGALLGLSAPQPAPAEAADAAAGRAKASGCAVCHGAEGVSPKATVPSLGGQQPGYFAAELRKYKSGARKDAAMALAVAKLGDNDFENLAAYYAGLKPMTAAGNAARAVKGQEKYAPCAACHGPDGAGKPQFPRLAGQQAAYLVDQLQEYKLGKRPFPAMNAVAAGLTADDIQALAAYLAGLK